MHRVPQVRLAVLGARVVSAAAALAVVLTVSAPLAAQTPAPAAETPIEHAQPAGEHAAAPTEAEHREASLADFFWPVVNFAILVGVLYYFLREPLTTYLRDRSGAIRKDLVEAAALKSAATAQLAEIDRKMNALPAEIDQLRTRGQAEIAAEEQRINQQAAAERDRLVDQARRQIDLQVRLAKRDLTEHAADLAVDLAGNRLRAETTPADHTRLVSRYLEQVKG